LTAVAFGEGWFQCLELSAQFFQTLEKMSLLRGEALKSDAVGSNPWKIIARSALEFGD